MTAVKKNIENNNEEYAYRENNSRNSKNNSRNSKEIVETRKIITKTHNNKKTRRTIAKTRKIITRIWKPQPCEEGVGQAALSEL